MSDKNKRLGVALFGLGRAGQFHLSNLARHPRAQLLYVVDIDKARVEEVAATYKIIGLTSGEEALADARVDAVIVATPTPSHYQVIISAIAAGKAIFTEKPVGYTLQEIDEVFRQASRRGLPILCGFNRRFDRSWIKCSEAVQSGAIGSPQIIRSTARDSPVPTTAYLQTSHGFFHDSGVHDIDVVRWMLQEDPIEVYATTHCYLPHIKELGDVDTIIMLLKFKSGCMGTIDLSRKSVYGYDQRVEVFGEKGMVQVENKPATSCVISNAEGVIHDKVMYSFPQRFEEAYYLEFDHFISYVLDSVPPRITHTDCRNAFIIAEAAMKSAATGVPVTIDYSIN